MLELKIGFDTQLPKEEFLAYVDEIMNRKIQNLLKNKSLPLTWEKLKRIKKKKPKKATSKKVWNTIGWFENRRTLTITTTIA